VNILVLSQDWFVPEFREAGHRVATAGLADNLEIQILSPLVHIDQIIEQVGGGFRPDVVVIHDNSAPMTFVGLEDLSCPIIFYAVDTHHHTELHCYLSQLFDYTYVAQRDYIPAFSALGFEAPEWLPLWAPVRFESSDEKKYGAVFVGTMNRELNPDRVDFFDKLKQKVEILCTTGHYPSYFPYAQVVINQTVKGDLNFRTFEAMMCGAALLTEESGNGLRELFTPDVHLATYEKNNVDQAAAKIKGMLAHPERTRAMAMAGREEVLARHTAKQRAEVLLDRIKTLKKRTSPIRNYAAMINYHVLGNRLRKMDAMLSVKAFAEGMKMLDRAIRAKEPIGDTIAYHCVRLALAYDLGKGGSSGINLLDEMYKLYPEVPLFKAAKLRSLLNTGRLQEATEFAATLSHLPPAETFVVVEKALQAVMRGLVD